VPLRSTPDFAAIGARRVHLSSLRFRSKYGITKIRLCEKLMAFLAFVRRTPRPSLHDCTGDDVVDFLVDGSSTGGTVVHYANCQRRGACECPTTKAAGTIDSEIGMLRGGFNILGRVGADNPCAQSTVKQFLADLRWEHAQAGISPTPAVPVFQEKLVQIAAAGDRLLAGNELTPAQRYVLHRDLAGFCLDAASGQRVGDLCHLRVEGILQFPGGDGLMFGWTWGKTLRGGGPRHVFGVRARPDALLICPVVRIYAFMSYAARCGANLVAPGALLFHPWRDGAPRPHIPLSSSELRESLQEHLKRLGIFEGETGHGFRAAFAIDAAIQGRPLKDIMAVTGWQSEHMAQRYMCMSRVMDMAPDPRTMSTTLYKEIDELQGFLAAFPTRFPS
jgi:integrase